MEVVKEKDVHTEIGKQIEDKINNDPKIPAWAKAVTIKNAKARQAFHDKKVKDLGELYTEHLKQLLNIYFNSFSEVSEENKISFDVLNADWLAYVQKANQAQKFIVLNVTAFETEVNRITETNEQFKPKEE